jgi:hypothetical protein
VIPVSESSVCVSDSCCAYWIVGHSCFRIDNYLSVKDIISSPAQPHKRPCTLLSTIQKALYVTAPHHAPHDICPCVPPRHHKEKLPCRRGHWPENSHPRPESNSPRETPIMVSHGFVFRSMLCRPQDCVPMEEKKSERKDLDNSLSSPHQTLIKLVTKSVPQ